MKNSNRYSVHEIEKAEHFPFDPKKYSQFKFGCGQTTTEYANEVSTIIADEIISKINNESIVIYPSPYSFFPTASCNMTILIFDILKKEFPKLKIKCSKINRKNTYHQDYGELDKEGRYNLIKNDTYEFVDNPSNEDVLIFIDDISVTGTHQRIIEEILEKQNIKNPSYFSYYAVVTNSEIPPNIENKLNYFSIQSVETLAEIFSRKSFLLNTRFVKKILSLPEHDFYTFYNITKNLVNKDIWNTILNGSRNNMYHKIPAYENNLEIMKTLIAEDL